MEIINGTKYKAKLTLKGKSSYYLLVPAEVRNYLELAGDLSVEVRFNRTDGEQPALILTKATNQ